jgi:hypothetical protein
MYSFPVHANMIYATQSLIADGGRAGNPISHFAVRLPFCYRDVSMNVDKGIATIGDEEAKQLEED